MQKDSMLGSDLSLVEPRHITGFNIQLAGSIILSRVVFKDEFQHLIHKWDRVLENLLEDQVQQCIIAVCSAINKNECLQENCTRTKSLVLQCCKVSLISPNYFLFIHSENHLKRI